MKTITSERKRAAPAKRHPKRKPARRAHGRGAAAAAASRKAAAIPTGLYEETPAGADMPSAEPMPDKRDEELSDEEALDREERQELY